MTLDQLPWPDGAGPRVLIVNHRRALAELLYGALKATGMDVLGTAHSAAQAVAMAQSLRPDVVVMDIEMPGQDGLAATRRLRGLVPDVVVAVLADDRDPDRMILAAQAGAAAFIPTNGSLAQLIDVLSRLRADQVLPPGQMLIAPSMLSSDPQTPAGSAPSGVMSPRLTRRELELLRCLGGGMQVKAIARKLGITLHTCRSHVKSLHTKLDSGTTLEAVLKAQRLGLLP